MEFGLGFGFSEEDFKVSPSTNDESLPLPCKELNTMMIFK